MKEIIKHEADLGGNGGKFSAGLGVDGQDLVAQIQAKMPIAKIVEPATKAFDSAMDKLEKLIPGDWDKPHIEAVKKEFAEQLVKLLAEKPAVDAQPVEPA